MIEVADASLSRDRGPKLRMYARAGIPVNWIVNLIDSQIEVYADPDPTALPAPRYRSRVISAGDATVLVQLSGQTVTSLKAADILPPV